MKKTLVISIMIIVVALVGVLASCSFKLTESDIFEIASFKKASPERNTNVYVYDGGTLIFSNVGGEVTSIKGFDFDNLITNEAGQGLDFKADYFTGAKLTAGDTNTTYTATISNPEEFLGVTGVKDATVEVVVKTKEKTLVSTKINYDVVKTISTYTVSIEVLVA